MCSEETQALCRHATLWQAKPTLTESRTQIINSAYQYPILESLKHYDPRNRMTAMELAEGAKEKAIKVQFIHELLSIGELYRQTRFGKWKSMIDRGLETFAKTHPNTFLRRTNRGIPQEFRWEIWKVALKYQHYASELEDLYESYSAKENEYLSIINIDVPRTFPELKVFDKEAQDQLYRILSAYGNYQPEIGYCQGMNFVAGLLLLVSGFKEKESFIGFVGLMNELKLAEFYKPAFPMVKDYISAYETLIKDVTPELHIHIKREDVSPAVFLHQWFLTLFVASLPLRSVVALWDYMLFNGLSSSLTVALALTCLLAPQLMKLNFEGILSLLKDMKSMDSKDDIRIGRVIVNKAHKIASDKGGIDEFLSKAILK
ncbi:TBC domain containing protein [Theileria equi strain WA]|uniref:TBC domain containing protein n=1 Tax=Theileria equi strain WA TaxID=1537102 RepID=L1LCT3_THEEQ|nr:TBC domain containing protein [Theileria equi strain WA]EKX72978.1 TBC domain containing protein [Theileria equi strain WA]|eukprot:XP_004832430.1 TBC domain containing protein [Theileria equi strain WA]